MSRSISNNDDIIDSRDVIARIEELETILVGSSVEWTDPDGGNVRTLTVDAITPDGLRLTDGEGGEIEAPEHETNVDADAVAELRALRALAEEGESYAPDWPYGATLIRDTYFKDYAREVAEDRLYGATLIRDTYFEDYARELAEDLYGSELRDLRWPFNCIDWEEAARQLQQDYSAIDFDGVIYWVR